MRCAVLDFFGTDDDDYDVVFTHNATAGLKLVGESYPFAKGSVFLHTVNNHNSVLGIRQYASALGASVVPITDADLASLLRNPIEFFASHASPLLVVPQFPHWFCLCAHNIVAYKICWSWVQVGSADVLSVLCLWIPILFVEK